MEKDMDIEDIKMVDVYETDETEISVVEAAVREAFYATARGKRELALSESRGKRLAAAYAEINQLMEKYAQAMEELERLGGLLNVIRRCADDEAFSIVFDNFDKERI
jgi:hypothetical protein